MNIIVTVSRTLLGLGSLNINDHLVYELSTTVFGGSVAYQTTWISSPYVDGDIPHTRRRGNVTDTLGVYVMGETNKDVLTNMQTLVAAMQQDKYSLMLVYDGATYQYECHSADYTVGWDQANLNANKILVTFSVPRKPVPTKGV